MDTLDRKIYLNLIQQIRNTEKPSIDDYIEKKLIPLQNDNPNFIKTLYKDITYVLEGIDKPGDNDLMVENGDFFVEDGELKLTGYQTRLHDVLIWLHQEVVKEIIEKYPNPEVFIQKIENFENHFLKRRNYTPEYLKELDEIKKSIKNERKFNFENKNSRLSRFLDPELLELKPNIFGMGFNLNELINKVKNK